MAQSTLLYRLGQPLAGMTTVASARIPSLPALMAAATDRLRRRKENGTRSRMWDRCGSRLRSRWADVFLNLDATKGEEADDASRLIRQ